MGLGWVGSYGSAGASNAIADILKERELKKQQDLAQQQQDFQNNLALRGANRADLAQAALEKWHNDEVQARLAATKDAAETKNDTAARADANLVPMGSVLNSSSPMMQRIDKAGLGDLFPQQRTLAAQQLPPSSDMSDGAPVISGQLRSVPSQPDPEHRIAVGTQTQRVAQDKIDASNLKIANDQTNKDAERARKTDADAQRAEYQQQLIALKEAGLENSKQALAVREAMAKLAEDKYNNPKPSAGQTDKSYNTALTELTKLHTPIAAKQQKMSDLKDTLAQGTNVADATVAPQLMSALAGGQGTGVRITQAEINSVVGGRTHWETLKSAYDKWSLDPSKPFLIQPQTRADMGKLIDLVASKHAKQINMLNDARHGLDDAGSSDEHRRIMTELQRALDAESAPAGPVTDPAATGGGLPPGVTVTKRP